MLLLHVELLTFVSGDETGTPPGLRCPPLALPPRLYPASPAVHSRVRIGHDAPQERQEPGLEALRPGRVGLHRREAAGEGRAQEAEASNAGRTHVQLDAFIK